jgi:hypothetical protein
MKMLVLALPLLLLCCASLGYVPTPDEEIYGTWENAEVVSGLCGFDFQPEGELEIHTMVHVGKEVMEADYSIHEKWTDDAGNAVYWLTWGIYFEAGGKRVAEQEHEQLVRVDFSQGTMETVSIREYLPWMRAEPTVHGELEESRIVDPQHKTYRIYHRVR